MTDLGDEQVPGNGLVLSRLKMRQAKFGLLILQAALDGPAGKGDMKNGFQTHVRNSVAEEVFFFSWVEDVACPNKPVGSEWLTIALEPEPAHSLDFPDHRSLFSVLDVETLPLLADHRPRVAAEVFDRSRGQAGVFPRVMQPTPEIPGVFHDITEAAAFPSSGKGGLSGGTFLRADPI